MVLLWFLVSNCLKDSGSIHSVAQIPSSIEQEKRMCEEGISSLNCLSSNPSAQLIFQVQGRVTSSYKGLIIVVQLCIEEKETRFMSIYLVSARDGFTVES